MAGRGLRSVEESWRHPVRLEKEREISNRTLDLLPAWLDTGFEMDWSALSVLSNITE